MSQNRHLSPARWCVLTGGDAHGTPCSKSQKVFHAVLCEHILPPLPHRKHELHQWLPLPLQSSDRLHWPQCSLYLELSSRQPHCLGTRQFSQLSGECCSPLSPLMLPYSGSLLPSAVSSPQAELVGFIHKSSGSIMKIVPGRQMVGGCRQGRTSACDTGHKWPPQPPAGLEVNRKFHRSVGTACAFSCPHHTFFFSHEGPLAESSGLQVDLFNSMKMS